MDLPESVREAVALGEGLGVTVQIADWRGVPDADAIDVVYLIALTAETIEVATSWTPDGDYLCGMYRSSAGDQTPHPLAGWADAAVLVRDMCAAAATA